MPSCSDLPFKNPHTAVNTCGHTFCWCAPFQISGGSYAAVLVRTQGTFGLGMPKQFEYTGIVFWSAWRGLASPSQFAHSVKHRCGRRTLFTTLRSSNCSHALNNSVQVRGEEMQMSQVPSADHSSAIHRHCALQHPA